MRIALALGHTQAWLAHHINTRGEPTYILLVLPWALTRALFILAYTWACWRHHDCFQ